MYYLPTLGYIFNFPTPPSQLLNLIPPAKNAKYMVHRTLYLSPLPPLHISLYTLPSSHHLNGINSQGGFASILPCQVANALPLQGITKCTLPPATCIDNGFTPFFFYSYLTSGTYSRPVVNIQLTQAPKSSHLAYLSSSPPLFPPLFSLPPLLPPHIYLHQTKLEYWCSATVE